MEEEDIIDLISEQKSMSETVEDYGDRRSTSISTARRLAEFLGAEMLVDKGLNCKYVIAAKPHGAPTSERAIPTDIFQADEASQAEVPASVAEGLRVWTTSTCARWSTGPTTSDDCRRPYRR